ncbi:hypothetical protein L5515_002360 [Caenorhabditis briggsae]|uniref:Uncharacterized protein n=1 Tax=Caenorhabditis briggsae TaxID=6238 RepID=A0AAE9E7W3_CAEBR|nr:hypothetical protein L5515_002360 [Caenorhabditis briggsae]
MTSSSPKSVVVTGANRGIGLTIVQELIKDKNIELIIATARDVERAGDLKSINDARLHILPLEVTCDKSIDQFVAKTTELLGSNGLNLLVNNAGVMIPYQTKGEPNRAALAEQFDVNTISMVILTQKLLPLLRESALKSSGDQLSISRCAVINISSGLASISQNNYGSNFMPLLAYSMSKTAVNQFTKAFSIDTKDDHILSVAFEPGWIKTNLGGPNAELTLEETIPTLVSSFYKLNNTHNGGYYLRDLTVLPY